MNRTAGSTEIGTAALLRRCGGRICARGSTDATRINAHVRPKKWRVVGCRTSLTLILLLLACRHIQAEPAHVWLSPSNIAPAGPEAPTIAGINGNLRFLNIWAQPATVGDGAWSAVTNPFKQLENISLNLVTNNSSVEFLNTSFVVHNPRLDASRRFEFVHDSGTGLTSESTFPDRIRGIQAFSISAASGFAGIGPTCHPNDPFCGVTPSGAPAWLVATVAARTIADAGSAEFRLQIGERGMNHAGEVSSQTSVVFGNMGDPVYNAGCVSNPTRCPDRQVTLTGDAPDIVLQAAPSSAAQAMHWQGASGQWSNHSWSAGGRAPSWTDNALLDATLGQNAVTVSGVQQANNTTVNGGRLHIADDGSLASEVVVNAGGTISGDGWIASNLSLRGALAASGAQPLKILGRADVTGGELKLLDGYTQTPNTISEPFVVLEALGGFQGTLSTTENSQLGAGLFLKDIDYNTDPTRILVQIRSVLNADYNDNGVADAADFVVWRKTFGAAVTRGTGADGNHSGLIDSEDYNIWRSQFGSTVGSGAGGPSTTTPLPEPATIALVLTTLLLWRSRHLRSHVVIVSRVARNARLSLAA